MSLYYLRHGLTDWNAKNVMQGRIDIPLNEEGKEEARKAKAEVDAIPLSLAVVSPLTRTRPPAAWGTGPRTVRGPRTATVK